MTEHTPGRRVKIQGYDYPQVSRSARLDGKTGRIVGFDDPAFSEGGHLDPESFRNSIYLPVRLDHQPPETNIDVWLFTKEELVLI